MNTNLNNDDVLSYEEFMARYKDKLKNLNLSKEDIQNMQLMLIDYDKWRHDNYVYIIENIYTSIVEIKYIDYPNGKLESLGKIIKNTHYLNLDLDFKYDSEYWNKEELCNVAYNNLLNNGIDTKYINTIMEEEFKPEHITDIEYYLNIFKKYCTNKNTLSKLDNDIWRYII